MARHTKDSVTQRVVDSLASANVWRGSLIDEYTGGFDFLLEASFGEYSATYCPSRYGWSTIHMFGTGKKKHLPFIQTIRAYLIWRARREDFIRSKKERESKVIDSIFINGGV